MRDRPAHPLTVIGLIVGLLLLAAWELWETSLSNVSPKAKPTSSERIAEGRRRYPLVPADPVHKGRTF